MRDLSEQSANLKRYWGYDEFLPLQAEALSAILQGHDSLTVLPTGGGKSLCYQIPALSRSGLVIVVCPLVALMKDQVDALLETQRPTTAIGGARFWRKEVAGLRAAVDRTHNIVFHS